ncbi:carbon storage regulator [Novipirellula sp. SH528]|uniref:carbon storage regulator n=1 Tax=Novipirellula sp. SH528 TaxID=3454466 RepID=UPI003F9FC407
MLVLSRKEDESIVINGNIKIVVTAIQRGRVRLGIEAPPEVPIHRQEVAAKKSELANRQLVLVAELSPSHGTKKHTSG